MRRLGPRGEDIAVRHLERHGYRILSRNYRAPSGEIDIVAEDKDTVVFVEVKTRSGHSFGRPEEAVHARKRRKLKQTALFYLSGLKEARGARFDIISVTIIDGRPSIDHIRDAFEVRL